MNVQAGIYQSAVKLMRKFWGEPLDMVAHPGHYLFTEGLIDPNARYRGN